MNQMVKWIGGATAVVLLILGTVFIAGGALEAQDNPMSAWLSAEDVLSSDPATAELALNLDTPAAPIATASPAIAPDSPFVIKRVLPISGPIRYGEWHWDDEGVPDGPLVVTVDLDARVISVFRNGYEIGAAAALLGTDEHPTPLGTFPILTKERHNISEKYGNAPMPWTLRLTWDGVAIHGGAEVELGYASHGCIGVPDDFASRLFDIASRGDKVIITRGQTANVGSSIRPG